MSEPEILLRVRATTRSSRNEIGEFVAGQLRVRTTAAPVDGRANREIIRLLSRAFGAPRSRISLLRGANSRNKLFRICGARTRPDYVL